MAVPNRDVLVLDAIDIQRSKVLVLCQCSQQNLWDTQVMW